MSKKLPVFFHIPKNAGTYIFNYIFWCIFVPTVQVRYKCNLEVLNSDGSVAYRIIGSRNTPFSEKYQKMNDGYWYRIGLEHFNFSDLDTFLIEVCDNSFSSYKQQLYSKLPPNIEPYEFLCLREPYNRIRSIYSYINSHKSAHEVTHKAHGDITFSEYLKSSHLEGSWLIRNLLGVSNDTPVTREHFNDTCTILDKMYIFETRNIDIHLKELFERCCKDVVISVNDNIPRNETINKINIPFDDLGTSEQEAFLRQVAWDREIYKKYIND